jgi:hypothetical protein
MKLDELDEAVAAMADSLGHRDDPSTALQRIVTAATEAIPGVDHASITRRDGKGELTTVVWTSPLAVKADEVQYELHEGPCYETVTVDEANYSPDLGQDPKWPRFGPRAVDMGLRSQMGVRLSNESGAITGLNLYAETYDAFDDSRPLTRLFASHASIALGYATELQSLNGALQSREVIGKAIGIVMERYDMTAERAFEFLIRVSQNSNTKLSEIATEIVSNRHISTK